MVERADKFENGYFIGLCGWRFNVSDVPVFLDVSATCFSEGSQQEHFENGNTPVK